MNCKNYKYKTIKNYCLGYCSKYNNTCRVEVKKPCQDEEVE